MEVDDTFASQSMTVYYFVCVRACEYVMIYVFLYDQVNTDGTMRPGVRIRIRGCTHLNKNMCISFGLIHAAKLNRLSPPRDRTDLFLDRNQHPRHPPATANSSAHSTIWMYTQYATMIHEYTHTLE